MWQFELIVMTLAVTLTNTLSLKNSTVLPKLENGGVHWALLVATTRGWDNYRHQAGICHAYQILSRNGIPDERIVVMMYDDIAYSRKNPYQGSIINHINGPNVYPGVPMDYTKKALNPRLFLNVLQGKRAGLYPLGSGKIIDSGPNDHVFVYLAGHGGPGVIQFPDDPLFATDLIKTLKSMHEQRKYAKMLIYIEADQSGSMLKHLPDNINILGVTATKPKEIAYQCYWDMYLKTYLGDVFSVAWMENSDTVTPNAEKIQGQIEIVKQRTNKSHVSEFGDSLIGQLNLSTFLGPGPYTHILTNRSRVSTYDSSHTVESHAVAMDILMRKYAQASGYLEEQAFLNEMFALVTEQSLINRIFHFIAEVVSRGNGPAYFFLTNTQEIENNECYEEAVTVFRKTCTAFTHNEHVLGRFMTFVNLCNARFPTGLIAGTIDRVCRELGQH